MKPIRFSVSRNEAILILNGLDIYMKDVQSRFETTQDENLKYYIDTTTPDVDRIRRQIQDQIEKNRESYKNIKVVV